jgi:hypothetical protein
MATGWEGVRERKREREERRERKRERDSVRRKRSYIRWTDAPPKPIHTAWNTG